MIIDVIIRKVHASNDMFNHFLQECMSCDKSCGSCTGPTEVQCTSCADEDHRLYSVEGEAHGNDVDSHIVGECVLCCLYGGLDSGHCCDCMDDGNCKMTYSDNMRECPDCNGFLLQI